jgi:putative Ca2+/H+ antiporter (TMEM165/GDT1 family)
VRRWRHYGGQWVMILSGAQSALAGGYMISQALGTAAPTILGIVPYVAFGAFYFLLSAIWLVVTARRKASA